MIWSKSFFDKTKRIYPFHLCAIYYRDPLVSTIQLSLLSSFTPTYPVVFFRTSKYVLPKYLIPLPLIRSLLLENRNTYMSHNLTPTYPVVF